MNLIARNSYEVVADVIQMDIGRDYVAVFDLIDLPLISAIRWCRIIKCGHQYAVGRTPLAFGAKMVSMHRIIVGVTHPRVYVDHINHDGLDNRRGNLRVCSQVENQRNKVSKGGSSRYLVVSFQKSRPELRRRWRAKIEHEGKVIELGYFVSEEEAARARDVAAKELFGEFASLNL